MATNDLDLTILVDTREQHPYIFAPPIKSRFVVLDAGDYTVENLESEIGIERKSLDDLVGTIIHNRRRFHDELRKLSKMRYACVVAECSFHDVLRGIYTGGASTQSVANAVLSIIVDWHVPVFFCSDRQAAREFTIMYLRRAALAIRGKG